MRRAPVHPAVRRAFAPPKEEPKEPEKPVARKGGLQVLFRTRVSEEGLSDAIANRNFIAAATADGTVAFVDASDGRVAAQCDELDGMSPNVMVFASEQWLVHGSDDANIRIISLNGELLHTHAVTEPAQEGKRPRCSPIDHACVYGHGDTVSYAAAAGRLIHACKVSDGQLAHVVQLDSLVRAMCAAPMGGHATSWAYAAAYTGGIRLVSNAGEAVRELITQRAVRSLRSSGPWLAAGAMDGIVELWEPGRSGMTMARRTMR